MAEPTRDSSPPTHGVPADLRGLLLCPDCRGEFVDLPQALACPSCRRCYPVVDGVPHLIPEQAQDWTPDQPIAARD
jgi:uncharacterized protein YbaR (Trm112 family)